MDLQSLIKKYDIPVPRYTSYPTVPYWDVEGFDRGEWWNAVNKCFVESNETKGISLYVHLPFCESLCTYCACNTRITKNHKVERGYIDGVLNEWNMYLERFPRTPLIREIHLGGGTPTFFSPENLGILMEGLMKKAEHFPAFEFSFEGHPNNTSREHLQVLYDHGFRRVSFGVQDLNEKVQRAINRIQPFENLKRVVEQSRAIGYNSVSFDLIYGLPYQTLESVHDTISQVISLRPDRIAFYSYAHVPWIKPGQRGYEDADLPSDVVKRSLYEAGRALFHEAGYVDIGMDHFATKEDSMTVAMHDGRLHRNFMGYTTNQTDLLIGLGTSSISDARYAYAQNEKKSETYLAAIAAGELALVKGHIQTQEDRDIRRAILGVACKGKVPINLLTNVSDADTDAELRKLAGDGLIILDEEGLKVTALGHPFIRNICRALDKRVRKPVSNATNPVFSKAI